MCLRQYFVIDNPCMSEVHVQAVPLYLTVNIPMDLASSEQNLLRDGGLEALSLCGAGQELI